MRTGPTNWVGVEAKRDGFPVLMRIRRLEPDLSLCTLFVVTWSYPNDHASQMPSQGFYSMIERFENDVIDKIEQAGLAVFVVSETGLGNTRYYFYTNSIESLTFKLDQGIPANEKVEFASTLDKEWHEYDRFIKLASMT